MSKQSDEGILRKLCFIHHRTQKVLVAPSPEPHYSKAIKTLKSASHGDKTRTLARQEPPVQNLTPANVVPKASAIKHRFLRGKTNLSSHLEPAQTVA